MKRTLLFPILACILLSFPQAPVTAASSLGTVWTAQTVPSSPALNGVTYGNGLFVAVSYQGYAYGAVTSPDGIVWTGRSSAPTSYSWNSVTYGNGLFVAVGDSNESMTSPDGITWTLQSPPSNMGGALFSWKSVAYGNGLFVAVGHLLSGGSLLFMTSPDGSTWTARTVPSPNNNFYFDGITYANGLFVAVSHNSPTYPQVVTSPDGINWTGRTAADTSGWISIAYGNGLFVAGATNGHIMTSPDGITWTLRTPPNYSSRQSIAYGNGLFVAAGTTNPQMMISSDGINWTSYDAPGTNYWWEKVVYGNGKFVAVGGASPTRVVTSPSPDLQAENLASSGSLTTGSTVTFTGSIRNAGSAAPASTARFCIDNSSCLTSSSGQIGTSAVSALSADASQSVTASWTATAGSHTAYLCADTGAVMGEENEANNCTSYAFTVTTPVNGVCGSSNGSTSSSQPVTNLCSVGSTSWVDTVGSDGSYNWTCAGSGGGTDASCSATRTFVVSASAGSGGTISPSSQTVAYGNTTTFTVTPNSGYSAAASGCAGSLSGTTYTTGAITASCTVSATFTLMLPDLTAGASTVPANSTTGQSVSLSSSVSNASGGGGATNFPNIFQIMDAAEGVTYARVNTGTVASLAAGASTGISGSYTFTSAGTYHVRACANMNTSGATVVSESNTGNNCGASSSITVSDTPAPSISYTPSSVAYAAMSTPSYTSASASYCDVYITATSLATLFNPGNLVWSNAPTSYNWGSSGPYYATQYRGVRCFNAAGTSADASATLTVGAPASCTLPWGGTIAHGASVTAYLLSSVTSPATCTSETRTCNNGSLSGSYQYQSCSVTPYVSLVASPNPIDSGQSTTLTWTSSGATSCTNSAGEGVGGFTTGGTTSGSDSVGPLTDNPTNYAITCTGPGGQATDNESITVVDPDATISATPGRVLNNATTSVNWAAHNVNSCVVTGPSGTIISGNSNGSRDFTTGSPSIQTITTQSTFSITCQTNSTPKSATTTVNVGPGYGEF